MSNKTKSIIFSVLSKIFMVALLVFFMLVLGANEKMNYKNLFMYEFIMLAGSIISGFCAVVFDRWKEYYYRRYLKDIEESKKRKQLRG